MDTLRNIVKKIWLDPVGSKLISAVIIGAVGAVLTTTWLLGSTHNESLGSATSTSSHYSDEELGYRNLTMGSCNKPRNYRKLLDIVRDLPTEEARELEIGSLIGDAVCAGDETFALEQFLKLTHTQPKDQAARLASDIHLKFKQFDQARKWASMLSNSQDKEWWLRRILRESEYKG